ncbi:MAG TPA: N,N-dimethylformamidase beta subunit family domain-containing protein [Gaiellaceae bacterium]|nr:N,N-dimethylformamidase beta subunit family domain-containing protein [Gaiellaceae bacterium]
MSPSTRKARLATFSVAGLCALAGALGETGGSGAETRAENPIQQENALPGSPGWLHPAPDGRAIEGYVSESSALPGDTLHFHVSTKPGASYRVVVYRLGWYAGAGARLVGCAPSCSDSSSGRAYDVPAPDENGKIDAGWPVTDQLALPATAVSGYYLVDFLLVGGPQSGRAATSFVIVRQPSSYAPSTILVQVPINTWQAYNAWGGRSLYDDQSIGGRRANHVSFNRPYLWEPQPGGLPIEWEYPLVRWLERNGYDVSYQTDADTDSNQSSLLQHKLVMTAGHGEYWTKGERDAFENAREAGVNLAFMGANTGYWQVRYDDGDRTIVAYKSRYDPEPDPALKTTMFRDLVPPRYECELLGIQFQATGLRWPTSDYVAQAGAISDPWFTGTGFNAGDTVKGIVSVETDTIPGNQTADSSCSHKLTVFFHRETGSDKSGNADAVRYTTDSGARVFASGSMDFAWGLDDWSGNPDETHGLVDVRLQKFMQNALADLTLPPPPPPPPPPLVESRVRFRPPRAGTLFTATAIATRGGLAVEGTVRCKGRIAVRRIRPLSSSSTAGGRATCTWRIPVDAAGKRFQGSIALTSSGSTARRAFSARVR